MGRQSRSPGAYGAGLLLLGLIAAASAQESSPDPDERRNRVTPTIRTHIYDRMLEAETCLGEGDSDCALSLLDQLSALRDLNTFEIANLHNFYAVVWYERDDFAAAATSYEKVLALPPAELTDGLIQAAMKNLSSTYWNLERPHDALELLDRWMALPTVTPLPRDWHLKATMHYQVEEYPQGIEALQAAIALAADQGEIGEEAWYQLLAAMYDELEQTERVIETLTILVENWTHLDNLLQLAGQLSLADRDDDTLALFEAAYEVGWLTSSNHLTTLASLYLQAEIPYQAAVVLEQGLGNGRIEPAQRNWDMLGQAWQRAGHHEQAVPVLEQASMLAEGGNVDVRLAQSYARLGRYAECIEVSRRGLERGGISDGRRFDRIHGDAQEAFPRH
jgi:tetratricopeptide (TPR) repeat protein